MVTKGLWEGIHTTEFIVIRIGFAHAGSMERTVLMELP
jgi:hypothetical protein